MIGMIYHSKFIKKTNQNKKIKNIMETRKITIVSTKTQSKKVIMSSATTLAELKSDLRQNGIDYADMTFFEGTSKVELRNDASVLPHDIPWKGSITNELVFMLTNTNKKIKSGISEFMSRIEAYTKIKNMGLQDACLKKFGKNFTMCKTADLIALIEENKDSKEEVSTTQASVPTTTQHNDCVDVAARAAITRIAELLCCNLGSFMEYEKEEILKILGKAENAAPVENKSQLKSPYSDEEIDDMFADMKI